MKGKEFHFMKVVSYMCEKCLEPYDFDPSDDIEYICPKCGEKMMYWYTAEIDPDTRKVIKDYREKERVQANPGKPVIEEPTVECPYCHSKYTRPINFFERFISTDVWGLGSDKIGKQFHCNNCDANF